MSWIYRKNQHEQLWTVGHYTPAGQWEPESDHTTPESAAARVSYLNGNRRNDDDQ